MNDRCLNEPSLHAALSRPDLTEPSRGAHPLQALIEIARLAAAGDQAPACQIHRSPPLVTMADQKLLGGRAPSTQHLGDLQLRGSTLASLPALLRALAVNPPEQLLLLLPGLAFTGADDRHELTLCLLHRQPLDAPALAEMIRRLLPELLPGQRFRLLSGDNPMLHHAMDLDVQAETGWVTLGQCGLLAESVKRSCGLDENTLHGLVVQLDLDRVLALRQAVAPETGQTRACA